MQIIQALKLRDHLAENLASVYRSARYDGTAHDVLNQRRHTMLNAHKIQKAPYWVSAYLEGYWKALMDGAYQNDLIFGAVIDNKFYSTNPTRDDYYQKHGINVARFGESNPTKGHYWKPGIHHGGLYNVPKPFFISNY